LCSLCARKMFPTPWILFVLLLNENVCGMIMYVKITNNRIKDTSSIKPYVYRFHHQTGKFGPQIYSDVTGELGSKLSSIRAFNHISTVSVNEACHPITVDLQNKIAIADRGDCSFKRKAFHVEKAGAKAIVVGNYDNNNRYVIMDSSKQENFTIGIPAVFINGVDKREIKLDLKRKQNNVSASLTTEFRPSAPDQHPPIHHRIQRSRSIRMFQLISIVLIIPPLIWCFLAMYYLIRRAYSRWARRNRRRTVHLRLPTTRYRPKENSETEIVCHNDICAVCMEEFSDGLPIKVLPCKHGFHADCIIPWLRGFSDECPICKRNVHEGATTHVVCNFSNPNRIISYPFIECIYDSETKIRFYNVLNFLMFSFAAGTSFSFLNGISPDKIQISGSHQALNRIY